MHIYLPKSVQRTEEQFSETRQTNIPSGLPVAPSLRLGRYSPGTLGFLNRVARWSPCVTTMKATAMQSAA